MGIFKNTKKAVLIFTALFSITLISGCGKSDGTAEGTITTAETSQGEEKNDKDDVDIDLTKMTSTMVYGEVYSIVSDPESYKGKTIRINGSFYAGQDDESDAVYYFVVIKDATACCSQGLEIVLNGEHSYPEDYPENDANVTVEGVIDSYDEDGGTYYCVRTEEIKVN